MTAFLENRVSPGSKIAGFFRARGASRPERIAREWRREILRKCKTLSRRGMNARYRVIVPTKRANAEICRESARHYYGVCVRCNRWRCVGSSKTCVACTYCI